MSSWRSDRAGTRPVWPRRDRRTAPRERSWRRRHWGRGLAAAAARPRRSAAVSRAVAVQHVDGDHELGQRGSREGLLAERSGVQIAPRSGRALPPRDRRRARPRSGRRRRRPDLRSARSGRPSERGVTRRRPREAARRCRRWPQRRPCRADGPSVTRCDQRDRPVVLLPDCYRSITVSSHVMRTGRVLVMLLVTLVIVAQAAASCPPLHVTAHAVSAPTDSQDCADHGPVEDDATPEARRGAVDHEASAAVAPAVAASQTRAADHGSPRRTPRRPPPAGRALLQRLCIART